MGFFFVLDIDELFSEGFPGLEGQVLVIVRVLIVGVVILDLDVECFYVVG